MIFAILLTVTLASGRRLKPPSEVANLTTNILLQFLDYDLIIHFDSTAATLLDNILTTKCRNQAVYLYNYDYDSKLDARPTGYGNNYINIVVLKDPFKFELYSKQPYNLYQYDLVLFITHEANGAQIWRMTGVERAAAIFLYNTENGHLYHGCHYCGNASGVIRKTATRDLRKLLNDYTDFNGHLFRIAYTNYLPFFWWKPNIRSPKGAEGVMLHEFSRLLNFRYHLVEYGNQPGKGVWQTMIEAVENGSVDWALGGLSLTYRRQLHTDFTRYIRTQPFSVLYSTRHATWTAFESILLVFQWLVWSSIAATVVVTCVVAKVANGRVGWYKYGRMAVVAMNEQTIPRTQMKLLQLCSVRTLYIVWWLNCLCLTTIYKSEIASSMISPISKEPQEIDELLGKGFRFHSKKDGWEVLKERLETSLDKTFDRVLNRITEDKAKFCDSVLAVLERKVAMIDEAVPLQYALFRRCRHIIPGKKFANLRLVTKNLFPDNYHAWSMPMGTPFRLKFSKTIARMNDHGLIDYWFDTGRFFDILSLASCLQRWLRCRLNGNTSFATSDVTRYRFDTCHVCFHWRKLCLQMGASLGRFWARVTEYPVKEKPICFHVQKNFTSTGEDKVEEEQRTDAYDELQNAFVRKLAEIREKHKDWYQDNFPFWDQMTIDNLHNIYMQLASEDNGMMDYKRFCWFLDSVDDDSTPRLREEKFNSFDTDRDGYVNIDDFLVLVYNYHPSTEVEGLRGVAKICSKLTEKIRSVTDLSLGQQLQHGLF